MPAPLIHSHMLGSSYNTGHVSPLVLVVLHFFTYFLFGVDIQYRFILDSGVRPSG